MREAMHDLRVRWHYHPTFRTDVRVTVAMLMVAAVLMVLLLSWASMSPACQRDTLLTLQGQAGSPHPCLSSL